MKIGYYYKIDGKWMRSEGANRITTDSPQVKEIYYYGPGGSSIGNLHKSYKWRYSNTKVSSVYDFFERWRFETPPEEDLIILEMMFP